jgi:hypothetical protein
MSRWLHVVLFVVLFGSVAVGVDTFTTLGRPAAAAPDPSVKVTVTLERIRALHSSEEGLCGEVDWYAKVFINGHEHDNEDSAEQDANEGDPDISVEWPFAEQVDLATLTTPGRIPLSIQIYDEDGLGCFGDEQYDASPTVGRSIEGSVDVSPCLARLAERELLCETSNVLAGTADDRAEVTFKVAVEEPPSAPGLRVNCLHSSIWPEEGKPVTINAGSLDGALGEKIADRIEIWVQPDTEDIGTRTKAIDTSGVAKASHVFTPDPDRDDFAYACRARKGDAAAFSGWHRVEVRRDEALPPTKNAVLYSGPRSGRLDIIFLADRDTYPDGADSAAFIADMENVIKTSYYGFEPFLAAQDKFNFWVFLPNDVRDLARADDANDGDCDHGLPASWDNLASIDAGAILHRKNQRDCALRGDRIFSGVVDTAVRSDALQVVTHETGHQPFGLADEYCCDGGYYQQDEAPNVYEEPEDCHADAAALNRFPPNDGCREWSEPVSGWADPDWSTSEPASNDLMNDNAAAQAADIRRFNFIFSGCDSAKC